MLLPRCSSTISGSGRSGSNARTVTVDLMAHGATIELSIRDDGSGFARGVLHSVFRLVRRGLRRLHGRFDATGL